MYWTSYSDYYEDLTISIKREKAHAKKKITGTISYNNISYGSATCINVSTKDIYDSYYEYIKEYETF